MVAMDAQEFDDLLNGLRPSILAGTLTPLVASSMKLLTPYVMLSKASYDHIVGRHPDITREDFLLVPIILDFALIVQSEDFRYVTFSYEKAEKCRYKLVVKRTVGGHEAWVSTLHRTAFRQTRRILQRGKILRNHL